MIQAAPTPRLLEVIVTSLAEAVEAERGGADRLEIVRSLDQGGLTPSAQLIRNIVHAVRIPARVILRSHNDFSAGDPTSFHDLCHQARELSEFPIQGFVAGFTKDDQIDLPALLALLECAPRLPFTFHRAFDALPDPHRALDQLRRLPQIDRILTHGCDGPPSARRLALLHLARAAAPEITILTGGSVDQTLIAHLRHDPCLSEFHVGRAARLPSTHTGTVRRTQVAALKNALL